MPKPRPGNPFSGFETPAGGFLSRRRLRQERNLNEGTSDSARPAGLAGDAIADRIVGIVGLLGGCAAIAVFLFAAVNSRARFVREVDSQGYFLMAQKFARLEMPVFDDDPFRFLSHVYVSIGPDRIAPKYTPGWPLCLAAGYAAGGAAGALWVNTVLCALLAIGFLLLALEFFEPVAAAIVTALFLLSPQLLGYVVYPLAHGASVAFAIFSALCGVRWMKTGRTIFAILTGCALLAAAATRPADVMIFPGLLLLMFGFYHGNRAPAGREPLRKTAIVAFCATFGILALLWGAYNAVLFGMPWRTGYYLTHEQTAFDPATVVERLPDLFAMRVYLLDNPVWIAALAGLAVGLVRKPLRAGGLLLWFVLPAFCYASYYWFHPGMRYSYTRFFLSMLPAAILAIGYLLDFGRRWWARIPLFVLAGSIFCSAPPHRCFSLNRQLNPARHNRVDDAIKKYMGDEQARFDFYAWNQLAWHASVYPNIRSFPSRALRVQHFLKPPGERRAAGLHAYGDPAREKIVREKVAAIGTKNVPSFFLERIRTALAQNRRVIATDGPRHPPLEWIGNAKDLAFTQLTEKDERPVLWEIVRAPDPAVPAE